MVVVREGSGGHGNISILCFMMNINECKNTVMKSVSKRRVY
jgi:hypothetical protein